MGAHDRMFVYAKAMRAVASCEGIARAIERRRPDLADQLRRASCSMPLNIAEGAAEYAPKEKLRLYRIARRSAGECEAALHVIGTVVEGAPDTSRAQGEVQEVFALLVRTAKAVEEP